MRMKSPGVTAGSGKRLRPVRLLRFSKNARGRQCGFCGERGHNARTCPAKKQHRKDCDAMRGLAHRVLAACLKKAGIVPGALMRQRQYELEEPTTTNK